MASNNPFISLGLRINNLGLYMHSPAISSLDMRR
jgi:hypothetical protein